MNVPSNIDALIAKYLSGEAQPHEAIELEDWCHQQPENKKYYDEMVKTMSVVDGKNRFVPSVAASFGRLQQRIGIKRMYRAMIAASFIAILSLVIFTMNENQGNKSIIAGSQPLEHQMMDLTRIKLSPGARIDIDPNFGKDSRKVSLSGEAAFNVKHDVEKKFIIHAGGGVYIEDLGTQFLVKAQPDSDTLFVIVAEGIVRLFDESGHEIILKAGEKAWYIRSSKQIITDIDTRVVKFNFSNTRLEEVIRLLSETYDIKIELQPAVISECRLTTQFFDEEIATIMTVICETLDFSYEYHNNTYIIKGRPCQ
ncbi:MAG TPA: FecR family protein [Saprospiraceae bacterium]|nr:FecR family protein [Saprospiraceae bacterium]